MRRTDLVNCLLVPLIVTIEWGNHLPVQRKIPEPVAPTCEVTPVGSADRVSYRRRRERARQDNLPNVLGYTSRCVHPQRRIVARYAAKGLKRLGRQAHPANIPGRQQVQANAPWQGPPGIKAIKRIIRPRLAGP